MRLQNNLSFIILYYRLCIWNPAVLKGNKPDVKKNLVLSKSDFDHGQGGEGGRLGRGVSMWGWW